MIKEMLTADWLSIELSTRRANVKRTGHHASNFAWRLQLGSFYVLATLSCALATASTVTSRPAQALDEDEHSKYCCCGPACRKESCCCGPRETSSSTPKPLEASTQSRVDFDGNLCLHRAPCHDSGLPTGPSVTATAKAAALDVPAFLAHPDSWEGLWQIPMPARPRQRDSRLDRPPEVHLASR